MKKCKVLLVLFLNTYPSKIPKSDLCKINILTSFRMDPSINRGVRNPAVAEDQFVKQISLCRLVDRNDIFFILQNSFEKS